MTHKSERIRAMVASQEGRGLDARYLGFFECFNQGLFFEAHEVLEDLWLEVRAAGNGPFYQALIQLAGVFVHVQKGRQGPALALLKLAESNLRRYPSLHEHLRVDGLLERLEAWRGRLLAQNPANAMNMAEFGPAPSFRIEEKAGNILIFAVA